MEGSRSPVSAILSWGVAVLAASAIAAVVILILGGIVGAS